MVRLKSFKDIAAIWRSGQIAGKLHQELREQLAPGITTKDLDRFAQEFIRKHGGEPTFLGYRGYPAAVCVSINEEIVHGIPGDRVIMAGDLVSLDLGVTLDGYASDTAQTWYVQADGPAGDPPESTGLIHRLCEGTRASLYAGIDAVASGEKLRRVSQAVQKILLKSKLGIVRDLTGHGVGFALHEEPTVYNFDTGQSGMTMRDGLVIAIEPMATLGSDQILLGADDWMYYTADGSLAAHYEHSVALWDGEACILTDPTDEHSRQIFGKG